jgi:predicted transcriptional regulator
MGNKLQTLQIIYNMVKNDIKPSMSNILPNEIIAQQHLPWDEIVRHLNELQAEGYINMKPVSPAIFSITDKGFLYASSLNTITAS